MRTANSELGTRDWGDDWGLGNCPPTLGSKLADDTAPMPLSMGGFSEEAQGVQQHTPQPRFSHGVHFASLLNNEK